MRLATTTGDFGAYFVTDEERIAAIYRAGFRHIDLSFYHALDTEPFYMGSDWREKAERLKYFADSLGMDFVQSHAPSGNPLQFDSTWEDLVFATERSLEVCKILGIPNAVYHAGWAVGNTVREHFDFNLKFLERLYPTMEKTGVSLLVENSTRANMGEQYFFYDGATMRDFIRYANHPLLHACWDTGHANIEGSQYQDLLDLGSELYGVHVHDNGGHGDEHDMPYFGTINMDEVLCGLIDSGYQGDFTFEVDSVPYRFGNWQIHRRDFKRSEKLKNPPTFLKEKFEGILYDMGRYFLESYQVWED